MDASGTSTPTSMTVVATSTGAAPEAKASMAASFSAPDIRPVSVTTSVPASAGSSASRAAHSVTAAGEPHEVETIELHTSLSSTTDGDDAAGESCQDSTDEAAQDPSADTRAVDGAENAPTGSERRQEG